MRRDFDLIRKLLLFFEGREDCRAVEVPPIDGFDTLTIKYHLVLLYEAGLLQCEPTRSTTSNRIISVLPFELTWHGHEFIAKIRDETAWAKIKKAIIAKGGAFAFSIVNEVATQFVRDSLIKS